MRSPDADSVHLGFTAQTLIQRLVPHGSDQKSCTAAGEEWWLEAADIDLESEIVTIQKGGFLIAAIEPRPDGRLRVASYRPMDGKAIGYLIGLGAVPGPDETVCMRDNNWEYAKDCSAGIGNMYSDTAGESYPSYWEYGIGLDSTGSSVGEWRTFQHQRPVPAEEIIAQIGAWFSHSDYR